MLAQLWQIFYTFLFIGTFSFGGGYAMIPLIQKEVIVNHQWLTVNDFTNIIAIAESTPGPLAINTATYVGYKTAGVLGGAVATAGLVLPAYVIILILARLVLNHRENPLVNNAISGLRPIVVALILGAGLSLSGGIISSVWQALGVVIAFAAAFFLRIHPVVIIVAFGLFGVAFT